MLFHALEDDEGEEEGGRGEEGLIGSESEEGLTGFEEVERGISFRILHGIALSAFGSIREIRLRLI